MPTVHTNVTDENNDGKVVSELMHTFFHTDLLDGFSWESGDGLTVEGHSEAGLKMVTFTDTEGAVG